MITNNNNLSNAVETVIAPVIENKPETKKPEKKSLVSDKVYSDTADKSGNPLIAENVSTRLYSNERVNGTTLIILAALSALEAKEKKTYSIIDFENGIKAIKANSFNNPAWKRLEANYKRGDNRSTSPVKKLNPVLSGLLRAGKNGLIKGFKADGIADIETRKVFGFNF